MALWEYKVITSGKGGFASATMLESYLNQLGKDEWEIIDFRTDPANTLAFHGLARRPTQREWTLEAAVAAAAKAEADKLRAELMQKQHAGDVNASADAPEGGAWAAEKAAGPESLRKLRDTDLDHDPEALADEASHGADDWNDDAFEDDLPVFFDAIKPHLRKNPSTPGQSVALNYLAKRWEQPEPDLHGALVECGFVIPENETEAPVYLDYEGDLYWVEKNNRGQFFLNTREKPRPRYRVAQGKPLDPADPAFAALAEEQAAIEAEKAKRAAAQAEREAAEQARRAEREAQRQAAEQARREQQAAAHAAREAARAAKSAEASEGAPGAAISVAPVAPVAPAASGASAQLAAPNSGATDGGEMGSASASAVAATPGTLPLGEALLDAIRPQMRRNRRGPGYSGSSAYLAKFFKVEEAALKAALAELGLAPSEAPGGKADFKTIGDYVYWVNKDGNGGYWINGREAGPRDRAEGGAPAQAPAKSDGAQGVAAATASVSDEKRGEAKPGEPPIFRAVPRAMPAALAPAPVPSEVAKVDAPSPASAPAPAPESARAEAPKSAAAPASSAAGHPLAAVRLLMKTNRSKSGVSGSLAFLAKALERDEPVLIAALSALGLAVPAEVAEGEEEPKPVFVEHGGEIFWISRYAKDGSLWLNAKAAKSAARKTPSKAASAAPKAAGDSAPKPRTKRRSASAIESDAAAEE
jgi:hypothetical protein